MKENNSRTYLLVLLAVLLLQIAFEKKSEATGGAFPFTKHGGNPTEPVDGDPTNTDRLLPNDGGVRRKRGVNEYVYPLPSEPYNETTVQYKSGECKQCHELHASTGAQEPFPNATEKPSVSSHGFNMTTSQAEGPDPYLLFSDNQPVLCWTCHETFLLNNRPQGWGYWGFYQGRRVFLGAAMGDPNNPRMVWPGIPGAKDHPRKQRQSVIDASNRNINQKGYCLNCHTPHGFKGPGYDNEAVPDEKQLAANNLSVVEDYLIPRKKIAWEEKLCETCHDPNGPALADIQSEINKRGQFPGSSHPNTAKDSNGGSGHPVDLTAYAGRHFAGEPVEVTFKHVECYDCHNPHADNRQNRLRGMRWVDIDGKTHDPADPSENLDPGQTSNPNVHNVCFRCHGNSFNQVFAGKAYPSEVDRRPPGMSNKRLEFDKNSFDPARGPNQNFNSAYHPVAYPGRNTSLALCLQIQPAFPSKLTCSNAAVAQVELANLTINCTDCHNSEKTSGILMGPVTLSNVRPTDVQVADIKWKGNDPVGPHGSKVPRGSTKPNSCTNFNNDRSILRAYYFTGYLDFKCTPFGSSPSVSEFQNRFTLCFNCHDWKIFYNEGKKTNFWDNDRGNLHYFHVFKKDEACMYCHYNIHSNVQSTTTVYNPPPDGNTHLLNFAPEIGPGELSGTPGGKKRWFYDPGNSDAVLRCDLYCHGVVMHKQGRGGYDCSHNVGGDKTDSCNNFPQ